MKILIASGGSGGHIFPAISLARELKKEESDIVFVASRRRLDRAILENAPYKKIFLSINPMPYKFSVATFAFWIKLFCDAVHSIFILARYRPDVVIGFGGYTAGTIVLLASIFGIKTVIHEQNARPGRTNKFLDRMVDKVAISFPETGKYFTNKKVVFTGNPLREESLRENRPEALERLGLDRGKMTILVMGGSQGAVSLNRLVSDSMALLPEERKKTVQLVHIAGKNYQSGIKKSYDENSVTGRVFEFMKNINDAYSVCDLAISRAGAAAVFELAAFRKPMILIPYPDKRNNQRSNAEFFEKSGAAIFRDEKNLSAEKLKDIIRDLIENPEKRKMLSENATKLSVIDGAKRLQEVVLQLK